jgi:hypothetical protein
MKVGVKRGSKKNELERIKETVERSFQMTDTVKNAKQNVISIRFLENYFEDKTERLNKSF